MSNKGKLFLIPTAIAAADPDMFLPPGVRSQIAGVRHFLAENVRTARRYLSALKVFPSIGELRFEVLDKDTGQQAVGALCAPLLEGTDMGVLSESGCPGVADPGARAVAFAHQHAVQVVPLVGPSSLLLALMGSGLNGQRFAFHGYLPVQRTGLVRAIKALEKESRQLQQTQIFIETPYRNNALYENLLKHLAPESRLCIAVDLTGPDEQVLTQTVRAWRKTPRTLPRLPAVFLVLA